MLTVLWNPRGFDAVAMLPPRATFNASWFIDGNSVPLAEKFFPGWVEWRAKNTGSAH
jgi:hypothetical protein